MVAAQRALGADLDQFRAWAHRAYARHADSRAEDVGLGHFFGGEAIAEDDQLRPIYRAASDFGRPNFGPTALFVANEATHERYPLIFADQAFHLGWAQLLFGWLLRAGASQLHLSMHARDQFPAAPPLPDDLVAHIDAVERPAGGGRPLPAGGVCGRGGTAPTPPRGLPPSPRRRDEAAPAVAGTGL